MNNLSPLENTYLEKLKKTLSTIVEYDHIQTLLKYVNYINDNSMYSFKYIQKCQELIRNKAYSMRDKDREEHNVEMQKIRDLYSPTRTIDNESLV